MSATWTTARPGDTLPTGHRLIARGLRRKSYALELAARPGREVWIDGPRTWAVVERPPLDTAR